MSATAPSSKYGRIVRILTFGLAGILVLGLQIGLPSISYHFGYEPPTGQIRVGFRDRQTYWKEHLRFEHLLRPAPLRLERTVCLSATICEDELIALFATVDKPGTQPSKPYKLIRFQLSSGRVAMSDAPVDVRYVLSDGHKIWWLPYHAGVVTPFLWDGEPAALVPGSHDPALCQLLKLSDGRWEETSQFAILPACFDIDGNPLVKVRSIGRKTLLFYDASVHGYFRTELPVGTEQQAREFHERHREYLPQMGRGDFKKMGWKRTDQGLGQSVDCYWWNDDAIFSISRVEAITGGVMLATGGGFRITMNSSARQEFRRAFSQPGKPIEFQTIASPLRWENGRRADLTNRGSLQVLLGQDQRPFVLLFDRTDRRIVLLGVDDAKLRLVSETRLSFPWQVIIDGILFVSLCTIIPTTVLALWAAIVQRLQPVSVFESGHETVALASILRRGFARSIDLAVVGAPLVLSVICHPELVAWCDYVTNGDGRFGIDLSFTNPDFSAFVKSVVSSQKFAFSRLHPPMILWLSHVALSLFVAQVVWQARSGLTIGKWCMGIRVLRTTLRPSGFTRSLLREILLLIETLVYLTWVFGALGILSSRYRQRLGDRWADTIVIRNKRSAS